MTDIPIAFASTEGKYNFEGVAQLVNCYAEKRGADAKAPLSVLPCDGIASYVEADGACRGMIYLPDLSKVYSIHPSSAYRITDSSGTGTAFRIGTVPGVDEVQLARNQNASPETSVQTEEGVQFISSDSLYYSADGDFETGIVTATNAAGYQVYGKADRTFYISSLNDADIQDSLDFATFEQRAGKLIRVEENAGELIGFCDGNMEFWRKVADEDFPFAPIAFRSRGLRAKNAYTVCDGSPIYVGDDNVVYRINNYDSVRISTHSVERLIQEEPSPSALLMFSYAREGHSFVALKGTYWTRVWDAATNVWHSRESQGLDNWRAKYAVKAFDKTLVGDALEGRIGYLSSGVYTEYGDTMIWGVDFPPMHAFPLGGIVKAVHFDLATGYGLLSGQGSDPKVMLWISKDGGNEFSQYRELSLGTIGKFHARVTARNLGAFGPKGIVFRLRISDPVVRALVAADAEVIPLKQ